ncbi:MAG: hypothetical protein FWG09_01455 [Synergistaceae bacterium]|nr:hypothetical protein [Synergistaceae bacterium]
MKKHAKLFTILAALALTVSLLSGIADAAVDKAAADKALKIASDCAKKLDGAWGDQHAKLIESKKGEDFADYESMQAVVNGFLAGSGATYIYVLYPSGPVDSAPFIITVDGSEEADDYGTDAEWEAEIAAAWGGTPTAGDEAWEDEDGGAGLLISAFAPIHDSKGSVVAILGVDYPAK